MARLAFNPTFEATGYAGAIGVKTMGTVKFIGVEFMIAAAMFAAIWGAYAIAATF